MTLLEETRPAALLNAAARTVGETTPTLDRNNFGRAQEWLVLLSIGAVAGTTPSMTVQIQDSDDGTTFANVAGSSLTATAVGFQELWVRRTRRYVRAVVSMTGTGPSFTYALIAVAGEPLDEGI